MAVIHEGPVTREGLDVVMERLGGEEPTTKARERFRQLTNASLERFQKVILDSEAGDDSRRKAVLALVDETDKAAKEFRFYKMYVKS